MRPFVQGIWTQAALAQRLVAGRYDLILGSIGHELVPLKTSAEAAEFLQDHKRSQILTYFEVTSGILAGLDQRC